MSQFVALATVVICLLVLLAMWLASVTVFADTIPPEDEEEHGDAGHGASH